MKTPGIYLIENAASCTVYLGQSANTAQRLRQHRHRLNRGTHANPHLQSAWNKHGAIAFSFRHLETVDDGISARCAREVALLADLRAAGQKVYNIGDGGEGQPHTPESCAKISKARTGMKFSEEHRQHMAESNRLRPPPSAETREKMRVSSTGRRYPERNASPEFQRKMAENRKKRKVFKQTEATKEKLRQINLGRPVSDEARQKMREARAKALARGQRSRIKLVTYDGKTLSIKAWAELTGIERQTLSYRLNKGGWSVVEALTTSTRPWGPGQPRQP